MDDSNKKQDILAAARFRPGQVYETTCWFTGGTLCYKVIDREGDTLYTNEAHDEIDGFYVRREIREFKIHEEDGKEYIVLYSYHGEENRVYAGSR